MALLTALEDFVQRSLSALPTVWEKLRFVSDLRSDSGYQHWGLEQKYGEKSARAAMAAAHSELFSEVASVPLAELWLAADQAAHREDVEVDDLLQRFVTSAATRPEDMQGVAREHFDFVVTNLSRVARFRSTTSRLAA